MQYQPKSIIFDEQGRQSLVNGIRTLAKAVKSTLGPNGNTVIIESPHHTSGMTITKDGVTVAKAVDLLDPVENIAVRIMKQAAERTAVDAGDGTTTSIILAEAIIMEGLSHIKPGLNIHEVIKYIHTYVEIIIESLRKMAVEVDDDMLLHIATVSANNDQLIGQIISDVYEKIGPDGVVLVERSDSPATKGHAIDGMRVTSGMSSDVFINDVKKDQCIFEDAYVLVCGSEISSVHQIDNVLKRIVEDRLPLIIIAPCTTPFINVMGANVIKNGYKFCVMTPPSTGYRQHELMGDIAAAVGATYFSEKTGDDLSLIGPADLGFVKKAIIGRSESVFMLDNEDSDRAQIVADRIKQLKGSLIDSNTNDKFTLERIAALSGGVGVIQVGGATDIEHKELYDRIEDAVLAVRSALKEGVLPGGGVALYDAVRSVGLMGNSEEDLCAWRIVTKALEAPIRQIYANSGLVYEEKNRGQAYAGHGWDMRRDVFGNMVEMGIIDPMKVTRCALENAVSVAATILTTNAIITMARTYEHKD
jgi:chaperonin GroEL